LKAGANYLMATSNSRCGGCTAPTSAVPDCVVLLSILHHF
jgi:hypothetical protein